MRLLVPIIAVAAVWMTVSCGGKSAGSQPVPTASLMASRPTVNTGQSVTLTWNSTNAASCTASGGWSGELAASGTQSSGTLDNDTDFSLSCTGAGGTSTAATTTVTVDPVPAAMLSAAPTSVAAGGTSTLTWSSTDATACTASGGWTGSLATSGTQATGALTADTTFSLTCTDPGGASPVA
ncbi:MAG: glu81, partial [Gammaproteobacteria bacterium]|nr:glu81 [Gammaproteobacteria bacterium]